MAIFDFHGNEITSVYDVDGNGCDFAYDVDGNEIPTQINPYSINNVVEWYRTPVLNMQDTISALSNDWDNSVFITDPHGSANKQHSQAIAMYLYSNVSNISRIILNGDYVSGGWNESEYTAFMTPFLESEYMNKIYATIGNHDVGGESVIYSDFLAGKTGVTGNLNGGYYYLDIPSKKLRLMFINTSSNGPLSISQTQLNWIAQNAVLPDTSWNLAVIGHINVNDLDGVTYQNLNNASALISAIESCNGHIVGYICGHQHIDDTRSAGAFQQTTLLCDRFENQNYYDGYSVTNRVADTITEQAVSVISINTTTKEVVVRRIGAGWSDIVASLHYQYE